MNELRRMAYLEALGVDSYVSRTQLPGAAPSRRLKIVASLHTPAVLEPATESRAALFPGLQQVGTPETVQIDSSATAPQTTSPTTQPVADAPMQRSPAVPRFSLTAILAGEWLWLEELAGMPLTSEQVHLVQSMAQALSLVAGRQESQPVVAIRPEVSQFDWPIHTNHQLDLGEDAARASVAGFVGRRLEQAGCSGLILLGATCAERLPVREIGAFTVSTLSSAEILARPALKKQVWRDLLPLVSRP